jgi:hypothetical protein
MKTKKITLISLTAIMVLGGCSSTKNIPGHVYSNVDYEMMGKQVSFSQYGFNALDKHTKVTVEKNRLMFLNEVDKIFIDSEERIKSDGILNIYENSSRR